MLGWQVAGAELGRRFLQHRHYSRHSRPVACWWLPSHFSVDRSAQRVAREHNMKQNKNIALLAACGGQTSTRGLGSSNERPMGGQSGHVYCYYQCPGEEGAKRAPVGADLPSFSPPPLLPSSPSSSHVPRQFPLSSLSSRSMLSRADSSPRSRSPPSSPPNPKPPLAAHGNFGHD